MPTLKEITTRAKKIRKEKPRTKWQNAIKQASKELKAKYRKKEGKVGTKRKRVVTRKKVGTTRKKVMGSALPGRKGWTVKGTHNVIYGVVRDTGKVRKFLYITTSYTEAEKYKVYRTMRDSGNLDTYIKEFIV